MRSSSSGRVILSAALDYAARGWPVLPLVPREKRPLTKRGLLDATTD
ncbi:MAG TPA: bifunctional DNA primase/polymerase, partial [Chloroflexota bacterium]